MRRTSWCEWQHGVEWSGQRRVCVIINQLMGCHSSIPTTLIPNMSSSSSVAVPSTVTSATVNEVKAAQPVVTLKGKVAIVTGSSRYVLCLSIHKTVI
jgi:hypothetical protein